MFVMIGYITDNKYCGKFPTIAALHGHQELIHGIIDTYDVSIEKEKFNIIRRKSFNILYLGLLLS